MPKDRFQPKTTKLIT